MRPFLLAALLALALSACGSDDEPATAGEAATGGAFPVSIEHKLGTAEIASAPKRVVALDFPSADAAIALGVIPVGMAKVDYVDGGVQAWTKTALGGQAPELLTTTSGIPLEAVAALRPDVILATNTYGVTDAYAKLKEIAPVLAHVRGEGFDSWQDSTVRIGRALGREAQAKTLIAEAEKKVAERAAFEGKTISFFNFASGFPHVINSKDDASIRFLADLGFALPPAVTKLKAEDGFRAQVSPERLDVLEADAILATAPAPDELEEFAAGKPFQGLDTVRRGGYVSIDLPTATSMAFPSVLSVPYAVDAIVPKLEDAVG